MNDIFIAIIVALILLIIGYVFQTRAEIKNKNIASSRLEWIKRLKQHFSNYNANLNNIIKRQITDTEEGQSTVAEKKALEDSLIKMENHVNKIQQEFKPYSIGKKNEAFHIDDKEDKTSHIDDKEDEKTKDLITYITSDKKLKVNNNMISTESIKDINLELFLMLILDEVTSHVRTYIPHNRWEITINRKEKMIDYANFRELLEFYQELILEVQKMIIKNEWERVKRESYIRGKKYDNSKIIKENVNKIIDGFNGKLDTIVDKQKKESNSVLNNIENKLGEVEIKKDSVLGILAETINEIYEENEILDYMTTSTGQRYIFTTSKDASHPNGKVFGNKKKLPLPLVIEGDTIKIDEDNSKKTVYVETNFNKTYAENLSELMKRKAGIK